MCETQFESKKKRRRKFYSLNCKLLQFSIFNSQFQMKVYFFPLFLRWSSFSEKNLKWKKLQFNTELPVKISALSIIIHDSNRVKADIPINHIKFFVNYSVI